MTKQHLKEFIKAVALPAVFELLSQQKHFHPMCYIFLGDRKAGVDVVPIYNDSDKQLFISRTREKAQKINADAILYVLEGFAVSIDNPVAVMELPPDNVAYLPKDATGKPCVMIFGVCRGMKRGLSWTVPSPAGGHAPADIGEGIETDSFWVRDAFKN